MSTCPLNIGADDPVVPTARGPLAPHSSIPFWFEDLRVCFHFVKERTMNFIRAPLWFRKLHVDSKLLSRGDSQTWCRHDIPSAMGHQTPKHATGPNDMTQDLEVCTCSSCRWKLCVGNPKFQQSSAESPAAATHDGSVHRCASYFTWIRVRLQSSLVNTEPKFCGTFLISPNRPASVTQSILPGQWT